MQAKNALYYGDNLHVLREHVGDETVDLVYLDPPFNSNASYNVLFKEHDGAAAASQIKAFEDTWRWDASAALAWEETVEAGGKLSEFLQGFRKTLGDSDMLAYLSMMAPRLEELRRVLRSTGSIYLHCDPTASHYLKLLLDAVFGAKNFKNEIVWKRTTVHSDSKTWSRVNDVLLYFSKGVKFVWNPQYIGLSQKYLESKYRYADSAGRKYRLDNITSPNPRPNMMYEWKGHVSPPFGWRYSKETMKKLHKAGRIWYPSDKAKRPQLKRYLDESKGALCSTLWTDINPINSQAQERLGYPTQKPIALLERIISASSNEGDLVLDPFCGCGTTIDAAEKLGRRWIGIDITHLAINLIKTRLEDTYGNGISQTYDVIGEPASVPDARQLAEQDQYQFQWWALGLVGARPAEQKKGADKGIDGRKYFHFEKGDKTRQIIFSVKAGKLKAEHVRDLRGVVEREKAEAGVLISMFAPTSLMQSEAASAGFFESPWGKHRKLQILTVTELLEGKRVDMPQITGADRTFKRAARYKGEGDSQLKLKEDEGEYGT